MPDLQSQAWNGRGAQTPAVLVQESHTRDRCTFHRRQATTHACVRHKSHVTPTNRLQLARLLTLRAGEKVEGGRTQQSHCAPSPACRCWIQLRSTPRSVRKLRGVQRCLNSRQSDHLFQLPSTKLPVLSFQGSTLASAKFNARGQHDERRLEFVSLERSVNRGSSC